MIEWIQNFIIEILIVTIIVYEIMLWIKNTKAWMLLRGMLMLGGFILLAWLFQMNTILYLARESINVLAIAAIVVFQPELRRALEKLGEKNLFSNINPFDKNKETLALAVQENIIDTSCSAIDDNFKGCSYIFLCAPVSYNTACLTQLKSLIDPDCILTDVGSVKTSIHEEIISLGMEENFIGGHPMAGSEKNGFANSKAHLIENAYYILTPSAKVSEEKINAYRNFVSSLKALPIVLDYRQHDCITGTISHLPHIIASTLVNFVRDTDTKEELMKALAAGGFKDITRIASSSPVMWQQICLKNGKNISHILGQYIEALIQAKLSIDTEDENALYTLFESSRDYRNSMPNTSAGPIKKQFAVYCDIIDETGGIATIATILASNNISIKNIGIIHNREFEEGVLRIEFYDESSSSKASALLKKYRYIVYEV